MNNKVKSKKRTLLLCHQTVNGCVMVTSPLYSCFEIIDKLDRQPNRIDSFVKIILI